MRRREGVGLLDMKDEVFQDGLFSGLRKTATRNKFSSLRIIKIHERGYISEQLNYSGTEIIIILFWVANY